MLKVEQILNYIGVSKLAEKLHLAAGFAPERLFRCRFCSEIDVSLQVLLQKGCFAAGFA